MKINYYEIIDFLKCEYLYLHKHVLKDLPEKKEVFQVFNTGFNTGIEALLKGKPFTEVEAAWNKAWIDIEDPDQEKGIISLKLFHDTINDKSKLTDKVTFDFDDFTYEDKAYYVDKDLVIYESHKRASSISKLNKLRLLGAMLYNNKTSCRIVKIIRTKKQKTTEETFELNGTLEDFKSIILPIMKQMKKVYDEKIAIPSGISESFYGKTQCSVCPYDSCKYNKDLLILKE